MLEKCIYYYLFIEETNEQNPLHKKPIRNNQIGGMASNDT
jgi:hypothetical protein